MPTIVYLSLGSNLNHPVANLNNAIMQLKNVVTVLAVSSFYETEPLEFTDQPWFVNCVLKIETEKSAQQLLDNVLDIERGMGRERKAGAMKKGPRIIDVDILLYGDQLIAAPGLVIPHPALHERRFVLKPLAEIASETRHPSLNRTAQELLDGLPDGQAVRKLAVTE